MTSDPSRILAAIQKRRVKLEKWLKQHANDPVDPKNVKLREKLKGELVGLPLPTEPYPDPE